MDPKTWRRQVCWTKFHNWEQMFHFFWLFLKRFSFPARQMLAVFSIMSQIKEAIVQPESSNEVCQEWTQHPSLLVPFSCCWHNWMTLVKVYPFKCVNVTLFTCSNIWNYRLIWQGNYWNNWAAKSWTSGVSQAYGVFDTGELWYSFFWYSFYLIAYPSINLPSCTHGASGNTRWTALMSRLLFNQRFSRKTIRRAAGKFYMKPNGLRYLLPPSAFSLAFYWILHHHQRGHTV